jgi:hypothetical protein
LPAVVTLGYKLYQEPNATQQFYLTFAAKSEKKVLTEQNGKAM